MFENASGFPWHVEGNVIYRVDDVDGDALKSSKKKTEIARFRIFQVLGESKLKGVSIDEAHDNAALVAHTIQLYTRMEEFLTDVFNEGGGVLSAEAKKLRDEFYPRGDVSQE